MKLHEKIHYYRTIAKLSQEDLAALVGVSRQAVSKWELGEATPEVSKLMALARSMSSWVGAMSSRSFSAKDWYPTRKAPMAVSDRRTSSFSS